MLMAINIHKNKIINIYVLLINYVKMEIIIILTNIIKAKNNIVQNIVIMFGIIIQKKLNKI